MGTTGTFIWCDLATGDPDAASRFYEAVVGWSAEPSPEHPEYRLLKRDGHVGGGLMALPTPAQGETPRWSGYVHVADVDETADAIRQNGGRVHFGPNDIPHVGRFAVVADPQGAAFMILAPLPRDEAPAEPPMGTAGTVAWRELHATDWAAVFPFYAERFGWEKDIAIDMGEMGAYQTFRVGGQNVGGMMNDASAAPCWHYYFAVPDIDAAHAAIGSNGGRVLNGPDEIPGGGFALKAVDPQGAVFGLAGPRRTGE